MNNFSPYLRVALNHEASDFFLNKRIIFDYELLYLKKGTIDFCYDSKKYLVNKNMIILIKPGITHSFIGHGNCIMPHIHFDLVEDKLSKKIPVNFKPINKLSLDEKNLIRDDSLKDIPCVINIKNHNEILTELIRIISISENKGMYFEIKIKSLILEIIHILLTSVNTEKLEPKTTEMDIIAKYIRKNCENNITLSQLSKKACLSKYHFERVFKSSFGIPPLKYHQITKLEKARYYLMYSNMSITKISTKLNYSSIHSFSKEFKKHFGMSPSSFKNSNLG